MVVKPHRFVALDSLRGICAVMVAVYHFSAISHIGSLPFIKNGFLFVDFFFVLSGFVIASGYEERLIDKFPISRFMFLRIARLYPLHLFMLLLYLMVALLKPGAYSAKGFAITALLLQTFSDGNLTNWNLPSWSISAEVWTYLVFAIICTVLPRGQSALALLGIVIAAPIFLFTFTDRYLDVCFEGSLVRCLFGFSVGVLAFHKWRKNKRRFSTAVHTVFELVALSACLILVGLAKAGPLSLACPFFFGIALLAFANEGGLVSRLLRTRMLAVLGTLSYSIYMTHMFIQARMLNGLDVLAKHFSVPIIKQAVAEQTLQNAEGFPLATDFAILIMIAVVVALSALTFVYIEDPPRRRAKTSSLFLEADGSALAN